MGSSNIFAKQKSRIMSCLIISGIPERIPFLPPEFPTKKVPDLFPKLAWNVPPTRGTGWWSPAAILLDHRTGFPIV